MDRFCSRGYPVTPVVVAVFDDADRVEGPLSVGPTKGERRQWNEKFVSS